MVFDINGKIALISGGASGIGLAHAKELLRNGLKGVTLADVNNDFGTKALKEIDAEFGPNKAIFVQTDVTNLQNYEETFKKTVDHFKHLDILINNAGIFNDTIWKREVAVNVNGVIHGMLLGLDNFIPKYRTGSEGVIINMSSIAGVSHSDIFPIYTATKFAVTGLTRSWGTDAHYDRTKVRVLALCPGATDTPILSELPAKVLGDQYRALLATLLKNELPRQSPEDAARALVTIVRNAKNGTVWVAEGGKDPYEYIAVPRQQFAPK